MSAEKIRFTAEDQCKFLNRTDAIERRARDLCARVIWKPEPWSRVQMRRAHLMRDLVASWPLRRMGWEERW